MAVEDEIAAVGDDGLAVAHAPFDADAGNAVVGKGFLHHALGLLPGELHHLDRQRKAAEAVDDLALVADGDHALRGVGDDLFPEQAGAAALDHVEVAVDFVGAVDGQVDLADLDAVRQIVPAAAAAFNHVDILVNAAGDTDRGTIFDTTPALSERIMVVNLRAPFFLTQDVVRRMLADGAPRGPRSIINVSSANALFASVERAEYCLSKTGVSMATKLYALRLADTDIRVYEIRPGVIETDMTKVVKARYDQRIADGLTPIRRFGTADEVGLAVATLAEGRFPFSTGDAFHIDGGLHIPHF